MMQVITQDRFGGSDVLRLETRALPAPGPGEVLLRVLAAGVNPVDAEVREGGYRILGEPPFTLGWDVAGIVEGLGAGATDFALGQRVFGMPRFPDQAATYATHVVAPVADLVRVPDAMGDAEAGAMPLVGLTAWQALVRHGRLQAGQRVLIHAGAGGFGHMAVQIAVALGAEVTATASASKLSFLRGLGVARAIDYAHAPLGEGYDFVIDPQAEDQALTSIAAAREGGRVICLNYVPDAAPEAAAARNVTCEFILVEPDAAGLQALCDLHERGLLKVHVARRFPLAQAAAAQDFLANERPIGKVVLEP
jgi:NADPH:quinone reductase-like Zn-dependent oxidoreductase